LDNRRERYRQKQLDFMVSFKNEKDDCCFIYALEVLAPNLLNFADLLKNYEMHKRTLALITIKE